MQMLLDFLNVVLSAPIAVKRWHWLTKQFFFCRHLIVLVPLCEGCAMIFNYVTRSKVLKGLMKNSCPEH